MWEIYAYHSIESLFGIFNAVAAIMASITFRGAVAAVAFCGFAAALSVYAFAPEKHQGWKWLVTIVLVYGVLFLPRATVALVDKTGGSAVRVVANVPYAMAVLGGLTSSIGNAITDLFETAFQTIPGPGSLPAELAYQRNGLMFGSRLIQETRRVSIPDPAVRTDLVNFVGNCTAFDLADGSISSAAFSTSADLWTLMKDTNPARFSIITTAAGATIATCDQVYTSINGRLPAQITSLTNMLGVRLNPAIPTLAAQAAAVNQISQAYIRSQIAAASATASDLVRQNALINAINDAGEMGCQRTNDPSCMMLATGRASAVAQQNAAWINGAKIAEQALPVVRNVAEATAYAVFPLVVLLLLLTSGKNTAMTLAGYVTALISIQLWPPLFAILNYMATLYAQLDQAAAAEIGGGVKALSLQTASPIYSNAVSAQAVVSYVVIGIPLLAYSLANRLVNFGQALTGGLVGLQSTIGNASAAAAVGNSSMGNVSMDQRVVSPSTSNPWVSRNQDLEGNWLTNDGTGRVAISMLRNEGMAGRVVSAKVSQGAVEEASRAADAARSEVTTASTERSAALADTLSRSASRSTMARESSGSSTSGFEELGRSAEHLSGIAQQVSKSTALSASQVQQIAFNLSAGLGTPSLSPVKGALGGSANKAYSSDLTDAEQKVANAVSTEQLGEFKRFGDRASRDTAFLRAISSEDREGSELASRLTRSTARTEAAQAAFTERQGVAERLSRAYESGESISLDLAQLPQNSSFMTHYSRMAAEYGENSQALQMAIASELATRALPPTRHFSSGAAAPASFGDIRDAHRQDRLAPSIHPDIGDVDRSNDAQVKHLKSVEPINSLDQSHDRGKQPPAPGSLSNVRDDLSNEGDRIRQRAGVQIGNFDQRNEITRDTDGTVGTKKALVAKNARQIRDDVQNLGSDLKDAVLGKKE